MGPLNLDDDKIHIPLNLDAVKTRCSDAVVPPAKKPARPYHHGDLRRALVEASLELVDAGGAAGLTLRGVARKLGVSHAAPGHHFADRAALLAAVAARGFEGLAEATERAANRATSPVQRLEAVGVAYVEFAVAHPERFRLMFGAEVRGAPSAELADNGRRAFDVLVGAVRAAVGDDDPERQRVTTLAAWSLVHGLATLWIDERLAGFASSRNRSAATRLAREVTALVARVVEVG
ncbi:MAG: hypothetical protein AMXMBFR56_72300 [Polyangiaceae bacterium]